MATFSKSLFSSVNASLEYNATEYIMDYNESQNVTIPDNRDNYFYIIRIITLLICLPGLVGNGIVIWLLGFRIKRTPFTTYILNLAIADFAVLTSEIILEIVYLLRLINHEHFIDFFFLSYTIFLFTFTASQFLMTIVSIDRCVCLFFPLWHRCHRPPRLSTSACAIAWILSFITTAFEFIFSFTTYYHIISSVNHFLNAVVCMPIMCVSSIAMFIKFCLRPAQKKKGKLLRTIWLTLFFFLLFAFPFNIIEILSVSHFQTKYSYGYGYISVFLNCAINPMIYYLMGRDKRGRSSNRINKVLEKLFKEEEDCTENQEI